MAPPWPYSQQLVNQRVWLKKLENLFLNLSCKDLLHGCSRGKSIPGQNGKCWKLHLQSQQDDLSSCHFFPVCLCIPRNWPITAVAYESLFASVWHRKAPSVHVLADSSPEACDLLFSTLFCQTCIKIQPNAVLEANISFYGGVFTWGWEKGGWMKLGAGVAAILKKQLFLEDYCVEDELWCAPTG